MSGYRAASVLVGLIIGLMTFRLLFAYWNTGQRIELERTGVIADGVVENLRFSETGGARHYIAGYSFNANADQGPAVRQHAVGDVSAENYAALRVGCPVKVIFEPSHPYVSELKPATSDMPKPWAQLGAACVWFFIRIGAVVGRQGDR